MSAGDIHVFMSFDGPGKVCCACKRNKPVSQFHKSAKAKDGLQSRCRECNKTAALAHQRKNGYGARL